MRKFCFFETMNELKYPIRDPATVSYKGNAYYLKPAITIYDWRGVDRDNSATVRHKSWRNKNNTNLFFNLNIYEYRIVVWYFYQDIYNRKNSATYVRLPI